jgi:ribosomal-protein-alanine N-acetyltransferase
MRIIKEKNLDHNAFFGYDNLVNILEIFRFENPTGYMIIRRSGTNFAIDFKSDAPIEVDSELKEILVPYFKGDLFISTNQNQSELKTFIETKGMRHWFNSFDMITNNCNEMTEGEIVAYNGELERYIYIFGQAFIPIRNKLRFKQLNYFGENPDQAKKIFEETDAKNGFYGLKIGEKIIAAAYAYENDIESIAVDPEFQGKGYGKQLLRGCLKDLLARYDEVTIGVVEINNKAFNLYKSKGFEVTLFRHNYRNFED